MCAKTQRSQGPFLKKNLCGPEYHMNREEPSQTGLARTQNPMMRQEVEAPEKRKTVTCAEAEAPSLQPEAPKRLKPCDLCRARSAKLAAKLQASRRRLEKTRDARQNSKQKRQKSKTGRAPAGHNLKARHHPALSPTRALPALWAELLKDPVEK